MKATAMSRHTTALQHRILIRAGMATPVWLSAVSSTPVGACVPALSTAFSGIMVLGIADSAASAIGRRYGRHRILGTRKTLEGTLGAVLCTMVGWLVLWPMCRCRGHENLDRCAMAAAHLSWPDCSCCCLHELLGPCQCCYHLFLPCRRACKAWLYKDGVRCVILQAIQCARDLM